MRNLTSYLKTIRLTSTLSLQCFKYTMFYFKQIISPAGKFGMEYQMKPTATALKPTSPLKPKSSKKPSSPLKRNSKVKTKASNAESNKVAASEIPSAVHAVTPKKPKSPKRAKKEMPVVEPNMKYPILQDEKLIDNFLKVPMSNNQKGRIRQAIKDSLQGSSNTIVPDIVHNKIQSILKSSDDLTDSQLRRIRILYNLLKTSLNSENISDEKSPKPTASAKGTQVKNKSNDKVNPEKKVDKKDKKEQMVNNPKGPKRYVVFLGNLPLDIDREKIMNHFSEMNEQIKNIRIPKIKDGKKSAIAYVELTNEPSYEFALSKHHSMLGNKRINVLYTTQKNGKITKGMAKSKSAKLIALQRSGKLVGSLPLAKKRSQRRLKLKQARAKAEV